MACDYNIFLKCDDGDCKKCGWNPKNEILRRERIVKKLARTEAPFEVCKGCRRLKDTIRRRIKDVQV